MDRFLNISKSIVLFIFLAALMGEYSLAAPEDEKRGLMWQGPAKEIATPYLQGKYRAVVIGNNNYQDEKGIWKNLKTAVPDAEAVAEVLKTDYGFTDVALLTNVGRREILHSLTALADKVEPNDSVLIYYAGHGHLDESTKRGYWIPTDAIGEDDTTFIRNSTIRDEVSIIAEKSMHTLLVSDSCFSGSLLRGGNRAATKTEKTNPYYIKVANKKSVQILAAGGVEYVDDNFRNSGHSPFTYFLISELKNNIDNLLTMSELAHNVIKAVANNVEQTPESGVLQGAGDELGEFIFARVSIKDDVIEIMATTKNKERQEVTILKSTTEQPEKEQETLLPLPRF